MGLEVGNLETVSLHESLEAFPQGANLLRNLIDHIHVLGPTFNVPRKDKGSRTANVDFDGTVQLLSEFAKELQDGFWTSRLHELAPKKWKTRSPQAFTPDRLDSLASRAA